MMSGVITVFQDLQQVNWGSLENARSLPRGTSDGSDWVDAVVLAMDMLHDKEAFSSRKIVLLTDFSGDFSDDRVDEVIAGLLHLQIDFSVIGPEFTTQDVEGQEPSDESSGGISVEGPSGDTNGGPSAGPSTGPSDKPSGPLSWCGKPKTAGQLAGEALVSKIVESVNGVICNFDEAIAQLIFYQRKAVKSGNWNSQLQIGPDFSIPITGKIMVRVFKI